MTASSVRPGITSLEDVFIQLMSEPGDRELTFAGLSFRRLGAMLAKETIQMRRDRITFAMMLGIPLFCWCCSATRSTTTPNICPPRW